MPKQSAPLEKIPATQLLVPENVPQAVWRLVSQHRADKSTPLPASLNAAANSVPFAWEECSDWLDTLTASLNATLESAEKASADAIADDAAAAPAAAATPAPTAESDKTASDSAAAAASDADKPADAGTAAAGESDDGAAKKEPSVRYKCSLGSCSVMSGGDTQLLVCGRCHNARYCS